MEMGVKKELVFKNVQLERDAANFGPEFFGGGLKAWRNKAESFAKKKKT